MPVISAEAVRERIQRLRDEADRERLLRQTRGPRPRLIRGVVRALRAAADRLDPPRPVPEPLARVVGRET
jgi:hypothetical protein